MFTDQRSCQSCKSAISVVKSVFIRSMWTHWNQSSVGRCLSSVNIQSKHEYLFKVKSVTKTDIVVDN